MAYEELVTDELTEIDSVSSFISAVKSLKESADGTSTEIYFRGQDAEFWDIEPSVFRNGMLSVEHKLMQIPLQKIPIEFKEFNTDFDIMTKYQHYGMCTRLLDLTTNPLVALYFACKQHGEEEYTNGDEIESHEPYGVVYYTQNYYPSMPTDLEVQIVSALAKYDLTGKNKVKDVLTNLKRDRIIDEETKNKWLKKESFSEFVKIIQKNYMVMPTYTNERLRKQSGVFLLASLFTISNGKDIANSVISKSKDDLRKEFEKDFYERADLPAKFVNKEQEKQHNKLVKEEDELALKINNILCYYYTQKTGKDVLAFNKIGVNRCDADIVMGIYSDSLINNSNPENFNTNYFNKRLKDYNMSFSYGGYDIECNKDRKYLMKKK